MVAIQVYLNLNLKKYQANKYPMGVFNYMKVSRSSPFKQYWFAICIMRFIIF